MCLSRRHAIRQDDDARSNKVRREAGKELDRRSPTARYPVQHLGIGIVLSVNDLAFVEVDLPMNVCEPVGVFVVRIRMVSVVEGSLPKGEQDANRQSQMK